MPMTVKVKGESYPITISHTSSMHPVFCGGMIWGSLYAIANDEWDLVKAGVAVPFKSLAEVATAYVEKYMTETTVVVIDKAGGSFATRVMANLPDKWKSKEGTEYHVTKIPEFRNQHYGLNGNKMSAVFITRIKKA